MISANHDRHGHGDDDDSHDQCVAALAMVQEFLHGELDEETCDKIRHHLQACESCLDSFDVESAIGALIKRCHEPEPAPQSLRMRLTSITIADLG